MAALLLALTTVCPAGVIANFAGDFQGPTPAAGWAYLTNTAGPITDPGAYQPLYWNTDTTPDVYGYQGTGNGSWPWMGHYNIIAGTFVHPGPANEYVIAAYTVQAGEQGVLTVNGSIYGGDGGGATNSDGWSLYIAKGALGTNQTIPWTAVAQNFTQSLGRANVGDVVYVAVGPNANHNNDTAILDFTITSVPEPGTWALLAGGLGLMALARRRN